MKYLIRIAVEMNGFKWKTNAFSIPLFHNNRSTWATVGAGVGHQDASNSIKTLLSRCEAKPSWAIYQSSRGKCSHNKPSIVDVTFSLFSNNLPWFILSFHHHQLTPLTPTMAAMPGHTNADRCRWTTQSNIFSIINCCRISWSFIDIQWLLLVVG